MNVYKTVTAIALCAALTGCAQSALEEDFGNSVRSMISAQTLNPNPEPAGESSGDGQRLEGVLEDYRKTNATRTSVSSETGLGVQ